MDLDDWEDVGAPSKIPPRRPKFAPKSVKLKPKTEQQDSKPAPKPKEQESFPLSKLKEGETLEEEFKPKINVIPKPEPSMSNGTAEMEVENVPHDAMEVDKEVAEEDMIVREIDVFFTPSIDDNTQLYVMQYPLRPCWRPYELAERCEQVRVKPGSAEVEIDLSIDVSANWDSNVADKLKMTKQTLSSSWTPPLASGYAVGVLMGNKLHLNPIHAVVQLRPSMEYLKSIDARMANNATGNPELTVKVEESNEGKPVGASRKQSKSMELGNEKKTEAPEHWIPLKYHDSKSDFSSRYLQKMVAQEGSSMEFTMSPYDYLRTLCPVATNDNVKPKGPSKKILLSLPLEERIKKLLLEGPPVQRFSVLKHFSPDDSVEDVLKVLQKHGQLVQGLWVPKSTLLFSPSELSKIAARDYVLLLFSKSVVINLSQINLLPKAKEDMKAFLSTYGVERPPNDWKFKEQIDVSFKKLYPDIVRQQEESWELVENKFSHVFNRDRGRPGMKKATPKPNVADGSVKSLNSDKSTTKTASGSHSMATMSNETRDALRKVLPKVFQTHKVCSFDGICQGLRDLAVSQSTLPKADARVTVLAASGADAPQEELLEVIGEVATRIHGFYVLKVSPDHQEYNSFRKVVIDLLLLRGPNAKLKRLEILEAARHALKRDVTNNEYNKVMNDFCEYKLSGWVLKNSDGKPS